jgi:sirohydrochlorin ferrochelatase
MNTALILFAHGARDPEWADPMRRVQAAIRQQQPDVPVELAFLEFMAPTLPDCIAALVAGGAAQNRRHADVHRARRAPEAGCAGIAGKAAVGPSGSAIFTGRRDRRAGDRRPGDGRGGAEVAGLTLA